MRSRSSEERKFWTKNRVSILVFWLSPLALSALIALFDIDWAMAAFVILSVIARIIVVRNSPFAKLYADSPELKEGVKLSESSFFSLKQISRIRLWIGCSGWIAFVVALFLVALFQEMKEPFLAGVSCWIIVFQGLSKTYLMARDLPLNGFPFFRSKKPLNKTKGLTVTEPYDPCSLPPSDIRHPMNPLNPGNIGNPANPNYIFKNYN